MARGFTSTAIGRLVGDGTLHAKAPGVYAVGHPHLTREGWWSVAVRIGGDGTLLSHRAGSALRGLVRAVDRTDIIVTQQQGRCLPYIRSHRCRVDDEDRAVVHGLPVTSLGLCLLDLAGREPRRLVEALEQAIITDVYDHAHILDVLDRYRGRRGRARLAAAVAQLPDEPARFRSRKERQARDLIVGAGLPEPEVNAWFPLGPAGGYELDLLWRGLGKNAEIDGPRHDLPWQQAKDRLRDDALARHGVEVQRHRVELLDAAPQAFVAEITSFLAESG